jgi:AhpD family alkylhydroperoxidase
MSQFQEQFNVFGHSILADGALSAKTKEIMAVALAHVTKSPHCIEAHIHRAIKLGATREELTEAIWLAALMQAAAITGGGGPHTDARLGRLLAAAQSGTPSK